MFHVKHRSDNVMKNIKKEKIIMKIKAVNNSTSDVNFDQRGYGQNRKIMTCQRSKDGERFSYLPQTFKMLKRRWLPERRLKGSKDIRTSLPDRSR